MTGANPSEAAIRFLGGNSNVSGQGAGRRVTGANPSEAAIRFLGGNSNVSGQGAGRRATGANPSEAAIQFLGGNSNVDAQGAGRRVIDLVRVAMINLVGLGVQDSGHSASKTNTKLKSKYKAAHREVFCYAQS